MAAVLSAEVLALPELPGADKEDVSEPLTAVSDKKVTAVKLLQTAEVDSGSSPRISAHVFPDVNGSAATESSQHVTEDTADAGQSNVVPAAHPLTEVADPEPEVRVATVQPQTASEARPQKPSPAVVSLCEDITAMGHSNGQLSMPTEARQHLPALDGPAQSDTVAVPLMTTNTEISAMHSSTQDNSMSALVGESEAGVVRAAVPSSDSPLTAGVAAVPENDVSSAGFAKHSPGKADVLVETVPVVTNVATEEGVRAEEAALPAGATLLQVGLPGILLLFGHPCG